MQVKGRVARQVRLHEAADSLRRQWRPVLIPALVLWVLSAFVAGFMIHAFDTRLYDQYAHAALRSPLLHRFPLEYPAPALIVFLLPLLLPFSYHWAFAVLVGIAVVVLAVSYENSGVDGFNMESARRLIVYLTLGEVMLLDARYDIFAAIVAFFALRAAKRGRWSAAWNWSSIGFLIKLFPGALWPVLLIAECHKTGRLPLRRLLWVGGSVFVLAGIPAMLNYSAALNALHYYLERPTEIGSIPAGLSLLTSWSSSHFIISFRSVNILNSVASPMSSAVELLAAAGCAGVWVAQFRKRLPIEAACLATLTLVMLGSKVLSVQYLTWLMPFWALYRPRASWIGACILNTAIYPFDFLSTSRIGFVSTHGFALTLTSIYLLRDLLIAWGTWAWLKETITVKARSAAEDTEVVRAVTITGTSLQPAEVRAQNA